MSLSKNWKREIFAESPASFSFLLLFGGILGSLGLCALVLGVSYIFKIKFFNPKIDNADKDFIEVCSWIFGGAFSAAAMIISSVLSCLVLLESRLAFKKAAEENHTAASFKAATDECHLIRCRLATLRDSLDISPKEDHYYESSEEAMKKLYNRIIDDLEHSEESGYNWSQLRHSVMLDIGKLFILSNWISSRLNEDIERVLGDFSKNSTVKPREAGGG